MPDFRSQKTYDKYMKKIAQGLFSHGCRLCQIKPIKKYKHWSIMKNEYPWDLVAKTNDMIVSKRHVTYEKLNAAEKKEFDLIKKDYMEKKYTHFVETSTKLKTIPTHFHLHLLVLKDKIG